MLVSRLEWWRWHPAMVTMNGQSPIDALMQEMLESIVHDTPEEVDIPLREMKLPVDEGLAVTIQSVAADTWDESHTHVYPEMDAIALHLVPPEAHRFDERVTTFSENHLADGPAIDSCGLCGRGEATSDTHQPIEVQLDPTAESVEVWACARCRRNAEVNGQ